MRVKELLLDPQTCSPLEKHSEHQEAPSSTSAVLSAECHEGAPIWASAQQGETCTVFPGVSATAFDPASALQAYTDVMRTEKENIAKGLLMYDKLDLAKQKFREGNADPVVAIPKKLSDMLPGYGSLAEFCHHLGYLRDPISGRFIPDESCSLEEKERTCLSAAPPLAKNRSSPSVVSRGHVPSVQALQRELKPLPTRPVRRSTSSSSGISLSGQD